MGNIFSIPYLNNKNRLIKTSSYKKQHNCCFSISGSAGRQSSKEAGQTIQDIRRFKLSRIVFIFAHFGGKLDKTQYPLFIYPEVLLYSVLFWFVIGHIAIGCRWKLDLFVFLNWGGIFFNLFCRRIIQKFNLCSRAHFLAISFFLR